VRPARTPPSTFLFLPIHLSNSPGLATPSLDAPESLRSSCHRPKSVTNHRKSEELRRRAFPPSGGAPCVGYICSTAGYCQPGILEFFIRSSSTTARVFGAVPRAGMRLAIADLQSVPPHSSHNHAASCRWEKFIPGTSLRLRYTINAIYDRRKRKHLGEVKYLGEVESVAARPVWAGSLSSSVPPDRGGRGGGSCADCTKAGDGRIGQRKGARLA
jgi:hypothetical protein